MERERKILYQSQAMKSPMSRTAPLASPYIWSLSMGVVSLEAAHHWRRASVVRYEDTTAFRRPAHVLGILVLHESGGYLCCIVSAPVHHLAEQYRPAAPLVAWRVFSEVP